MSALLVKPGVLFTAISPAGFHILWALTEIARGSADLTITSACDGAHSGPDDPHHRGEAYDIRIHDQLNPAALIQDLHQLLGTASFYAFIEDPGTPDAHIHCQLRKGAAYP
jgi:hypothetical protein